MKRQIFHTLFFTSLAVASLSFLFLFFFLSAPAFAKDPQIPTLTPYVNDFANVIDPTYESQMNSYATQLEAATTAEIAVMTVGTTEDMSIEEYAVSVFEQNGIGQRGVDNGILIVAAIEDREWRIEIGYGLEGDINDAKAGRIGRAFMTEYFKQERYGEGLYLTVRELGSVIAGNETVDWDSDAAPYDSEIGEAELAILMIVFMVILMLVIVGSIIAARRSRCPKCKEWMRVEYRKNKVCYVCPKCGYERCKKRRDHVPFFLLVGGGRGGGFGGGGGGFGGGRSGGGGASGGW
jgi:uncharacterized protein